MLYEAITGQTPFSSTNYNALLRMIVEDEAPSLHSLRAADAELSAIVAQGMSKDPAQRYPSMSQLGRALAQWLINQGVTDDVCGVSLEAKWLSRTTEARAVASDAGTPISISPYARSIPPGASKLYLGIAGGAVALAALLVGWGLSDDSAPPARGAAAPGGEPPLAAPEPKTTPVPASPPTPFASPADVRSSAPIEPKALPATRKAPAKAKARPVVQAAPEPTKAVPAPAKAADPASDLISPY
jgi:serine/threonine-protein kinase